MSPGPRPAPRACPAGRRGPHTRLLRAQAARTRPEPAPRRKPHHRPPAAAAVGTSSSQEELPRAEHRAKGGPAPSLTTQTNMGRTPPPPPPRARWADGGFLLKKHTNPYALTHTPARTVPSASDDCTWLGAGHLSPSLKRRVPRRPGSPGAPGTSVPKPRQRRSLHITACAATASPPRVPRPPGSAVPLPRGSDCVAFHGEGLSRTAAPTHRTRVTTRPGACAGGGGACPLSGWKSGCTRDARLPPDNHMCARTRVHTCADTYSCTHTHMHLHTCTLVHGHV